MSVRIESNLPQVETKIKVALVKSLGECGLLISSRAKLLSPVDTGNLRRSIGHKVNIVGLEAEIYANATYAPYLEFGTRRMSPRPFLRPAGDNSRRDVENIFRRNLRAVK